MGVKGDSDLGDVYQRDVSQSSLDVANVSPMQSRSLGQLFLTDAEFSPALADAHPKASLDISVRMTTHAATVLK